MNELYVLDTHTLLWYMDDDARLGYKAGQILDDDTVRLLLPSIVLNEMHDRQIVATALLAQTSDVQVVILTKDENIQNSNLVPTIW